MPAPFPRAGELAALASSLSWAVSFLIYSRLGARLSPGATNLGKNLVALACFAVTLVVLRGAPWPTAMPAGALALFLASGLCGLTGCDTLLFGSMHILGAQRTALLMTLAVPLTALAAMAPPLREMPTLRGWAGMVLCLGGIVLVVFERPPEPIDAARRRRGLVLGLLAAVLQAAGVLLARRAHALAPGESADGATVRLGAGVAGLLVLGLATGALPAWSRELRAPGILARLAPAAGIGAYFGIWLNQAGLAWAASAGVATTLNSLSPVFLIPLSTLFLGERHDRRAWLATLLTVAGVALLAR